MSHSGRRDMQIVRDRRVVRGPGAIKTAIWTKPTATEPKVALEAYALSDPKRRDHATLDCLAALAGSIARRSKLPPRPVEVSRKGVMLAGLNLGQQLLNDLLRLGEFRHERLAVHIVTFHDTQTHGKMHLGCYANSYVFRERDFRSFSDNATFVKHDKDCEDRIGVLRF